MDVTPGHLLGQVETDERLIIEMDNRPDLTNIRGALQGGMVATLIDIAAGRLAGRHVGPDQDVTTADMNVHFLAAVVVGPARAEATIVRAGGRLIVTAVDVTDVETSSGTERSRNRIGPLGHRLGPVTRPHARNDSSTEPRDYVLKP